MNSVRRKVEHLMSLDQNFRDNDKALTLAIWREYGLELTPVQKDKFLMCPSAEVITRRRREFSHKYPASPKVLEKRFKNFKQMTDDFSKQGFVVRLLKRKGI